MQLFILPVGGIRVHMHFIRSVHRAALRTDISAFVRGSLSVAFHGSILSASGKLRIQSSVQRYGVLWNDISFGTDYLQRIANFCRAFVCQLFVGNCTRLAD